MTKIDVENLTDNLDVIIDQLDDILTLAADKATRQLVIANKASFDVILDNVKDILEHIKDG